MVIRPQSHSDLAIKQVTIGGSSVLMIICFILVLIFNKDDTDDADQIIAFFIAIGGIIFFGTVLFLYVRSQLKNSEETESENDIERSEEINQRDNDPPPSYENPPSFDSYSKKYLKNINTADSTCHV